eukprot:jgi/Ulvmu1/3416/UM016_0034.1
MLSLFRCRSITPLCAVYAGLYRNAGGAPSDLEAAQRELDEFFGTEHESTVVGGAGSPSANPFTSPASPWRPPAPNNDQGVSEQDSAQHATLDASARLSHVDEEGRASMVDVAEKADTVRVARASAVVHLGPAAYAALHTGSLSKGSAASVLATAELAGTMAAKQTPALIPLCHSLLLTRAAVLATPDAAAHAVRIASEVRTVGRTGVEMEALTAAAVAALTVYDMCKAASKEIVIEAVQLEGKSGGQSGDYVRGEPR